VRFERNFTVGGDASRALTCSAIFADLKGEISSSTDFKLVNTKPVDEFEEAKAAGIITRPVVLGPITYLLLGKTGRDETNASFQPIDVLDKLVPVFAELLQKLQKAGATEVQIDEPALVLDAANSLGPQFASTYAAFAKAVPGLKITLATYFGRLDSNVEFVAKLPIHALHVDLDRAPEQLESVVAALKPTPIVLSLGLVSGRNVWKNDLAASLKIAESVIATLGADRVVVATSSSLLHTPVTLANESKLKPEVADWFSFATEKVAEVATLAKAISSPAEAKAALEKNATSIKARRDFEKSSDAAVRERLAAVTPEMYNRKSAFPARIAAQNSVHQLPAFRASLLLPPFVSCSTLTVPLFFSLSQPPPPSDRSPRPRRSVSLVPSSARASSRLPSTTPSLRRRFRPSSSSRRRLDLTSLFTESLSATTWFRWARFPLFVPCGP
jgi:5-methyltetrahydropteroyltriglutamate--homocysteine methyltransferase